MGLDSKSDFEKLIKEGRPDGIYINVMICTDCSSDVKYFNKLDKNVSKFDVIDDYYSEKIEVEKVGNKFSRFCQV